MYVAELWRYPIKSLAGERLEFAELTLDGIAGDRIVHVRGPHGPLTARTRHGLVTVPVRTGPDGSPQVAGHPWHTDQARAIIETHGGAGAELAAYEGPERFDVLNLLVATDGAVYQFGHDIRRLRPNLLIAGVPARTEPNWPGQAMMIGDAIIGIHTQRHRCVVTSIDPDTGDTDPAVSRRIRRLFDNQLALNCWVIRPGTIRIGDIAHLEPTDEQPADLGGWIVGASYNIAKS